MQAISWLHFHSEKSVRIYNTHHGIIQIFLGVTLYLLVSYSRRCDGLLYFNLTESVSPKKDYISLNFILVYFLKIKKSTKYYSILLFLII